MTQSSALKTDNLIEIDHVTFGYDASRTILNDVSLDFERGKVTAILGGSGSGKSSLVRARVLPVLKSRDGGRVVAVTPTSDPVSQ